MPGIRTPIALLLALVTAGCTGPAAPPTPPPAPTWSFSLDGEPLPTRVISMTGHDDRPGPGDLVEVGPWLVPLEGEPRAVRFETDLRGATGLALRLEGGTLRRVGLAMDPSGLGVETLAALPDAEARALRCVRIEAWSDAIARQVARLDAERVAVVFAPAKDLALPPLPAALRWLATDPERSSRVRSVAALEGLRALRFLRIATDWSADDDAARLVSGMEHLMRLELERQGVPVAKSLGNLPALRVLRLSHCTRPGSRDERPPISMQVAVRMPLLRRLDLWCSEVKDLGPLGGHPALEDLRADGLTLAALPDGPMPALRLASLVGTAVPAEALAAFRAAHPAAEVRTSWRAALEEVVAGADRVVLRTRGVCHRRPGEERLLHEGRGRADVLAALARIGVEDTTSPSGCMCCGDATVEFRAGPVVLAALAIHHGYRLRWPGGWPGDGILTLDSREALTEWIAAHGEAGPREEWHRDRARARAAEARWALLQSRMPPAVRTAVRETIEREALADVFRRAVPDPVERAAACLRLYGCGDGTWTRPLWTDFVIRETLLPEITPADLRRALLAAPSDPALADGAARWLLEEDRMEVLDGVTSDAVLAVIAARALEHPRVDNRREAMATLAPPPHEAVTPLLRRVLRAEFTPRTLPEVLVEEPFRGFVPPRTGDVHTAFSERAYAALLLARRGDRDSLGEIEALRASAPDADHAALDEAIRRLRD